jgi:hypothetical protein
MISRKGTYQTAWSSFGLMKLYHDGRRRQTADKRSNAKAAF